MASQTLPPPPQPYEGVAVHAGPNGDAVVSAAWLTDSSATSSMTDWTVWFEGLSSQGEVRWTGASLLVNANHWTPAGFARVDLADNTWFAGNFTSTLTLGAPVGSLNPGTDVATDIVAFGPDGRVVSGAVPPSFSNARVGATALDASGHVVVLSWDALEEWATDGGGSLVVTKLGF